MPALPQEKLDKLVERWEVVQSELNAGPDPQAYAQLNREFAELDPLVANIRELRTTEAELRDLEELAKDPETDSEMREMAAAELGELKSRLTALQTQMQLLLLPKDAADERSAIVEIRAGTGGDEAALFAADLFRMYQRYADLRGWQTEIISMSENDLGGYREIIASFTGKGVFARLKYESGVHRVQRVPETETSGRIHTSAATVAVLPQAEDVDVEIKTEDIRIDTMRASGAGGQHVNKTDSAVRIVHIPTGITVISAEKSQHQNRRLAMKVLRSRIYDQEADRRADERAESRKTQVGSGDRSQRIRTYNFPQGRVSDHRINLTLHKLGEIIAGDGLDEMIEALISHHQAEQLASLENDASA
ncbi:MAG: peptide chain release factor 1 [Alphaproteobacteria bacterium]|nr:peptide chain release factor 1 [Alphaproteobacteria bacterium]